MTTYVKELPVDLQLTRSIVYDAARSISRLKVECVLFGDYRIESISDVSETASLADIEAEFQALEAEVAKRISNVRIDG